MWWRRIASAQTARFESHEDFSLHAQNDPARPAGAREDDPGNSAAKDDMTAVTYSKFGRSGAAMFRLAMIVLITALSCEIGSAQEDRYSANHRMKGCRDFAAKNDRSNFDQGICVGVVQGLEYAATIYDARGRNVGRYKTKR
jgi:hypothetical protein